MKKSFAIFALIAIGLASLDLSAVNAATFVQIGNTAANSNSSWVIQNYPRGSAQDAHQNELAGAGEVFSATSSAEVSALTVYIGKDGAPTTGVKIDFCTYPTWATTTQPCESGGANLIATWTLPATSIVTNTGTNQDAWAQTLSLPGGTQIYPTNAYGITVTRDANAQNSLANSYRVGFSSSSSFDSSGTAFLAYGGTCGGWTTVGSTSPSSCSTTSQNGQHVRFYLSGSRAGALSLSVHQNGPETSFSGSCVKVSDLPPGWTLNDNLVYLQVQDVTSATGTSVVFTSTCESLGTYNTLSQGLARLWNGTFNVKALQPGIPGFTAAASFTVTGSTVTNPVDALNLCITPDLFDAILHPSSIKSSVSCSLNAMINSFANAPPFSWYTQIQTAVTATSAPTSIDATLHWPNGQPFILYSSASSTAGLAGKINSFPLIGGKTVRQLENIFLWCCFALYVLILPTRFVKT